MSKHKLTNLDIATEYQDLAPYLMINNFRGAFACWVIMQDESRSYDLSIKAIKAYTDWLERVEFTKPEMVIQMPLEKIKLFTSKAAFEQIPEILAMNQIKKGFVDLGALSRNVYYHILREVITQPL